MIPLRTAPDRTRSPSAHEQLIALLSQREPDGLLLLGTGPLPIEGSLEGAVALNAAGGALVAVRMRAVSPNAAVQLADELDRLAQMTARDLDEVVAAPKGRSGPLEERFAATFGHPAARINHEQAALVLLDEPPSDEAWRRLVRELGPRLQGVFQAEGRELIPLEPPVQHAARQRSGGAGTGRWAAAGTVVLGALLLVGALVLTIRRGGNPSEAAPVAAIDAVAGGLPAGATHTQWIGQQHIVHTADGHLLALIPSSRGLEIVADGADDGATWRRPSVIHSLHPSSFAAALDGTGKLHLAFTDSHGVGYAVLRDSSRGWRTSRPLRLDRGSKSPVVDVAWDGSHGIAHVVWARNTPAGEEPFWAAVGQHRGKPAILATHALSGPGRAETVLANDAVDPVSGELLVTFRSARSANGWSSRSARKLPSGRWRWSPVEQLPTRAFIGAAALAMDARGTAHLVLRDSTNYRLLYFKRAVHGTWSTPEVAVQAHATSQIDFPALALDTSSRLVYLFFESDQFEPSPQIRVAVREPASGWQSSTSVAASPQGDHFPTALRDGSGQAVVLWTQGSAGTRVEAGRVLAP